MLGGRREAVPVSPPAPWTQVVNTVGFYNRKFFMLFLVYTNVTLLIALVTISAQMPDLLPWAKTEEARSPPARPSAPPPSATHDTLRAERRPPAASIRHASPTARVVGRPSRAGSRACSTSCCSSARSWRTASCC